MKKLVAESLQEYRGVESVNEEVKEEQLNEGVKEVVAAAIAAPKDEKKVNGAIAAAFKTTEQMKNWLLKQPIEKKVQFLTAGAEKLKDPKMGFLKYVKDQQGQWVVGAVPVQGNVVSGK